MAYPMMYCPKWAEMRADLVENYGVTLVPITQAPGQFFLQRTADGATCVFPFPVVLDDDETVTVSFVRQLCLYLKLPKAKFGLTIEDDNPVQFDPS